MKKNLVCWCITALLLVPLSAVAAPSTDDLSRQINSLTEQLNQLKQQLNQVQESSDDTSLSVADLQADAEKWNAASRFQFSGDYRFRMDYSDADTPAYWSAESIAGAVADMNAVTGMQTREIIDLMGTFTAEGRQDMIENLPASLAQMGLMQQGIMPGTDAFADAFPAALSDVSTALGPNFENYQLTPADNYENDILYTNRLRLNITAKASENLQFKGRLAMYKAWGMQSNPTSNGPFFLNRFSDLDGGLTRQPADSVLRVDRAYINWVGIADLPIWFSIGRRPTTDGPPAQLRQGLDIGERMETLSAT